MNVMKKIRTYCEMEDQSSRRKKPTKKTRASIVFSLEDKNGKG